MIQESIVKSLLIAFATVLSICVVSGFSAGLYKFLRFIQDKIYFGTDADSFTAWFITALIAVFIIVFLYALSVSLFGIPS